MIKKFFVLRPAQLASGDTGRRVAEYRLIAGDHEIASARTMGKIAEVIIGMSALSIARVYDDGTVQVSPITDEGGAELMRWNSIEAPPTKAGYCIVGNRATREVGMARYMPKKREWKFPSAAMAFEVDVWAELPVIPSWTDEK